MIQAVTILKNVGNYLPEYTM